MSSEHVSHILAVLLSWFGLFFISSNILLHFCPPSAHNIVPYIFFLLFPLDGILAVILFWRFILKKSWLDIKSNFVLPRNFWTFIIWMVLTWLTLSSIRLFSQKTPDLSSTAFRLESSIFYSFYVFIGVTLVPIAEELFFRGVFLSILVKKCNIAFATVIVSLAFALIHANYLTLTSAPVLWDRFSAFVVSVVLSVIYLKSKKLSVPIVCHSIYNLCVVIGWTIFFLLKI